MYSEQTESRKTLGDVDVIYHDGLYHLFHLVLPNHDFIAHAVSDDCFSWRRVENALFIGHPGSWDDSMLWTVHVSPNPFGTGWRMFYTGLSRRDKGLKQRVGLAESDDLYRWTKSTVNWTDRRSDLPYELPGRPEQPPFRRDVDSSYPLSAPAEFYESELNEGRHWVSWRDPFYYRENGRGWLLVAARVKDGPVVRRGCVGVLEETSQNEFVECPPLHHPGLYDDIEVPNLCKLGGEYYLLGSLREDAKIRYWHAKKIGDPWLSYADNVLAATGNYAGRICQDDKGYLLWCFFTFDKQNRTNNNFMPPPKRLVRADSGELEVHTFEGFQAEQLDEVAIDQLSELRDTATAQCYPRGESGFELRCRSGFQAFVADQPLQSFRLSATLRLQSNGKCGLAFRVSKETHDGYYLSLDLFKGVAQVRSWGSGTAGTGENMMQFRSLQQSYWQPTTRGKATIDLIAYGSYIELSVEGRILLSLVDRDFVDGAVGFYVESATLAVEQLRVIKMRSPVQSDEHLAEG